MNKRTAGTSNAEGALRLQPQDRWLAYCIDNENFIVLRQPVECSQYTSIKYSDRLGELGYVSPSKSQETYHLELGAATEAAEAIAI